MITTELPKVLYDTIGETGEQRHTYDTRRAGAIRLPQIRNETGRRRINSSAVSAYYMSIKLASYSYSDSNSSNDFAQNWDTDSKWHAEFENGDLFSKVEPFDLERSVVVPCRIFVYGPI